MKAEKVWAGVFKAPTHVQQRQPKEFNQLKAPLLSLYGPRPTFDTRGEMMADWLDEQLVDLMSDGFCPDCGHRGWVLGPRGGASINIECGGCRARFNVVQGSMSHRFIMAHRIPKKRESGVSW